MDAQQTKSPSLVTDLQINLRICQHAFKFLPDTVSDKNSWDTLTKRCFSLLVLPSSLSKLLIAVRSPNLVTNIEGIRRPQSVLTILTETVACINSFPQLKQIFYFNISYLHIISKKKLVTSKSYKTLHCCLKSALNCWCLSGFLICASC